MYIPEFIYGLIVGALLMFFGFMAWSVWLSKKSK